MIFPRLAGPLALALGAALPGCDRSPTVSRESPVASSRADAGTSARGKAPPTSGPSIHPVPPAPGPSSPPAFPGAVVTLGAPVRSTPQLPPAPSGPFAVTTLARFVANVDEEKTPDLTVVEQLSDGKTFTGRAYVLHGRQGGSFDARPAWYEPFASRPRFPQLRDLDDDGALDLTLFTEPDRQRVYLRKAGAFVAAPSLKTAWGCPWAADLDGDGKTDLLCYQGTPRGASGLRPLFGLGEAKFAPGLDARLTPAGLQWSAVVRAGGRERVVVGESLSSSSLIGVHSRSSPPVMVPLKVGAGPARLTAPLPRSRPPGRRATAPGSRRSRLRRASSS